MRARWKEYVITILLWTALVVVASYIIVLLFPEQTARWKQAAEEVVQKTITKIEADLQSGESKLTAYISSDKMEVSIFDRITPIVSYVETNVQNKNLGNTVQKENTQLAEPQLISENTESAIQETQMESSGAAQTTVAVTESVTAASQVQQTEVVSTAASQIIEQTSSSQVTNPPTSELASESVAAAGTVQSLSPKVVNLISSGKFVESQITDYNYLLNTFYIVDKGTSLPQEILNPLTLLSKNLALQGGNSNPQILIYHTHSQEAFADSVPGERSQTIVGMGDYLTELLTNTYGYKVIHHTGVYDMTDGKLDRDPAYTKALPEITKILEENPSIEVVIDLHRDGVREDIHLVTDINGQPTAKVMFFNGLCRGVEEDNPELPNNYREDNLAFSLQLALLMKAQYPDLFRVIYTRPSRYNQHLRPKSILIECGAQTNTVQEARNTMPILADLIHQVLTP